MAERPFLSVRELSKSFGSTEVLSTVSFDVERGEVLALLGPSGSGKTTALRLLAGFETPDAGSIAVAGEEVTRLPPAKRRFGMVFQHYALFPHLTVGSNVAFGLDGTRDAARRVAEALALVDLEGFAERPVSSLSGGQQQRVALARALAPEPRVLLLDEPLSNLDPSLRERTRRELLETIRRVGITTVLVTHEQDEAFELGDRVGVLNRSRLEQIGPPEELYELPANAFVATFVGRATLIAGTLDRRGEETAILLDAGEGEAVRWPGRPVAALAAAADSAADGEIAVEAALRPEALRLVDAGAAGSVGGRVRHRRFAGATTYFRVALDGGRELEVAADRRAAAVGDRVAVSLVEGARPPIFPRTAR